MGVELVPCRSLGYQTSSEKSFIGYVLSDQV